MRLTESLKKSEAGQETPAGKFQHRRQSNLASSCSGQPSGWFLVAPKPYETSNQLSRSRVKQKRRPIERLTVVTRRMNQREFRIAQRGGRVVSGAYTFVK